MKVSIADATGKVRAEEYISHMHAKFPNLALICMKKHCAYEDVQEMIKDITKVVSYSCFGIVVFDHMHVI